MSLPPPDDTSSPRPTLHRDDARILLTIESSGEVLDEPPIRKVFLRRDCFPLGTATGAVLTPFNDRFAELCVFVPKEFGFDPRDLELLLVPASTGKTVALLTFVLSDFFPLDAHSGSPTFLAPGVSVLLGRAVLSLE